MEGIDTKSKKIITIGAKNKILKPQDSAKSKPGVLKQFIGLVEGGKVIFKDCMIKEKGGTTSVNGKKGFKCTFKTKDYYEIKVSILQSIWYVSSTFS